MRPERSGSGVDFSEQAADFCIDLVEADPNGVIARDDDEGDRRSELTSLESDRLAEDPFNPVAIDRRTVAPANQYSIAELVAGVIVGGKKRPG